MDRVRIGYPAGYLRFFWIRIGFEYSFVKTIGSGQDQDIGLISITKFLLRVIQDVTNDGDSAFFALVFTVYCQYVLHSSQSMVIRVTLSLIFSGQVEVASCSYTAGMLLCLLC